MPPGTPATHTAEYRDPVAALLPARRLRQRMAFHPERAIVSRPEGVWAHLQASRLLILVSFGFRRITPCCPAYIGAFYRISQLSGELGNIATADP